MSESCTDERRKRIVIGELKDDFLRISPASNSVDASSRGIDLTLTQIPLAQQTQLIYPAGAFFSPFIPPRTRGRLNVTIVQASLTKNYGLVRMDPYCRLRFGAAIFETPTDLSGGKTPHWNRTIHGYLPDGIDSLYLEIFDERAFTYDERIAWAQVALPQAIFSGETIDDWYSLSGASGEGKEGMVNLVISFNPLATNQADQGVAQPLAFGPVGLAERVQIAQSDVVELHDMFPDVEEEVIRGILEEKGGSKEAAVNSLLAMSAE